MSGKVNKNRQRLGWILVGTGLIFLFAGLVVATLATTPLAVRPPHGGSLLPQQANPSFWVELADKIAQFVLALLQVQWTPARVGVFLILVGLAIEAVGGYLVAFSSR